MQGLVVSLDRGYPLVRTERGEERAQHAIDLVKNVDMRAAVGDRVELSEEPGQDTLFITKIQPRTSTLVRRELVESIHDGSGKTKEQVLAANFDVVMIVQSLGKKPLDLDYLERQLVIAHESGKEVVILLTKADQAKHLEEDCLAAQSIAPQSKIICRSKTDPLDEIEACLTPPSVPPTVIPDLIRDPVGDLTSPSRHTKIDLADENNPNIAPPCHSERSEESFQEQAKGQSGLPIEAAMTTGYPQRIGVLLGRSGVGKSTLVNLLRGEELQATGSVRKKDNAGRHVTVARRLVDLSGGAAIIDTPGMRAIGVLGAEHGLAETFPEITAEAVACRYRDCTHTHEPDCAVVAAVEAGKVSERRLASYRTLAAEVFD